MKLLITTQILENYAWREDGSIGTGADAYWKAKGGEDYIVTGKFPNDEAIIAAVMCLRSEIEQNNDYVQETILGWTLVDNDYLTDFERSQLEYEGKITYPARQLVFS